jgi:hypothetical protein
MIIMNNLKLREHVASCKDRTPGMTRWKKTVRDSVGVSSMGGRGYMKF